MDQQLKRRLCAYARCVVRAGVNIQPGQTLFISADVSQAEFARCLVRQAYEAGAGDVTVMFGDEQIGRMAYDHKDAEAFKRFPEWRALLQNGMAREGAAFLFITSEDPLGMAGVDQEKVMNRVRASNEACKEWRDGMDFGRNVWCIVGGASPAWAARVFPDLPEEEATARLWDAILRTARVDGEDPVADWEAHKASFDLRKSWLNDQRFTELRYRNSLGTDISVGLAPGHRWMGGGDETVGGTFFFPNMPTEEVFTTPHRLRVNGRVVSSIPLNHAGTLIEGIDLTFENGRVISFDAKSGRDALEKILEVDEGARYLGEIALVPKTSPIRQTGILFLNTLFDENASCHFAVGMGFPDCHEGGRDMGKEELLEHGVNDSATHVDFMIGTDDLSITGVKADGTEVAIFRDGDWAF